MVFTVFGCLFVKEIQIKVSLASMKPPTNCKNTSSSNPLQGACFSFPIAACDSIKVVPKGACDTENCSESWPWLYTGENRPIRAKESWNRNFILLTEQFLELVIVQRSKQKLNIYFLLNTAS